MRRRVLTLFGGAQRELSAAENLALAKASASSTRESVAVTLVATTPELLGQFRSELGIEKSGVFSQLSCCLPDGLTVSCNLMFAPTERRFAEAGMVSCVKKADVVLFLADEPSFDTACRRVSLARRALPEHCVTALADATQKSATDFEGHKQRTMDFATANGLTLCESTSSCSLRETFTKTVVEQLNQRDTCRVVTAQEVRSRLPSPASESVVEVDVLTKACR